MKYTLFFLLWLSLLLSGCSLEEAFESREQRDGDDINVIQDVWPQAFDQALNLDPNTILWSQSNEVQLDTIAKKVYLPSYEDVPIEDVENNPVIPSVATNIPQEMTQTNVVENNIQNVPVATKYESDDKYDDNKYEDEWDDDEWDDD